MTYPGEDTPSVPDLIRWLRERAEINRRCATRPPEEWERQLLPFFARRLEQAANALEKLSGDKKEV